MNPLHDLSHLTPNLAVSKRDDMVSPGEEEAYFEIGRRALDLAMFAGRLCDKPHFQNILDLPCGHGRVMRWLRAQYDYATITGCDLDRDGVDFCAQQFGAQAVYSERDLTSLPFRDQFDFVWCGSLLTHLNTAAWLAALDCLIRWTSDCGVIMFSVQGRFFSSLLARGEHEFSDNADIETLLHNFSNTGTAFEPYFEDPDQQYGLSLVSPEYLTRVLQRYPNVIMRAYLEQAWGVQDVVILYKREGFYEPLLGTPA
ncbi:class I SAM-dependent methyltransferase [Synoicihabitans lomoniglobus]|uniref:Class I SAM-dependent methyltransferase n=1 Tax=Synoicihabitans lomoniglobus TaxID=2909285 RepID=A0AAF0CRK2_9BACT|nr:class I SAM-dependent methyltransferase [Opitutaceae bacterium LMO-M01]WED66738.1 class I SAM-dependent methyltransferase [Opitutaceae bacterium LMO-M01]